MVSILNFKDAETMRCAIGNVPHEAAWGSVAHGPDFDRYLCVGPARVTAWFEGIVTSVWLTPSEGSRVSIGVKLLCKRDHDAARYVQYEMCQPPAGTSHVLSPVDGR